MIRFWVPGLAAPGGSRIPVLSKSGKVFHRAASKRERPWRAAVQLAAGTVHQAAPLEGPLVLTITFVRLRPKAHFGKHGLKAQFVEAWPTPAPDCTKTVRAVEDALNGIVWRDDSQVVVQHIAKVYGEQPGARIVVRRATWDDRMAIARHERESGAHTEAPTSPRDATDGDLRPVRPVQRSNVSESR